MTYLDKPWLKGYKLGPYKLEDSLKPIPLAPVYQALDHAAENYPAQTAILFEDKTIKYRQLKTITDKLASGLAKLGVKKGDRICIFLPNCIEFIISDWGVLKAGAVVVPTSILRSDEGLLHEAGSSNSRVIICLENQLERVLGLREDSEIEHIILTSEDGYRAPLRLKSLPKGVHSFSDILESGDSSPPQVTIEPEHDLCELAFTGGATGVPKGVMVTHANRYSVIQQGLPWLMKPMLRGFTGKSSILVAIPLFHAYGHYVIQSAAFLGMRTILLGDPRDTKLMAQTIHEYRPFLITGVPTQFMRIAQESLPRMNSIF
jgi:long-chain acyl-CoA synthetase